MNEIDNYKRSFKSELKLLNNIRVSLCSSSDFIEIPDVHSFKYNHTISQVYITLFQIGVEPLRWGSKQETLKKTIQRIIFKLKTNSKFINFEVNDSSKCRIMFEIVTKEYPCSIRNLTTMRMNSPNRFEPGINGLKWKYQNITRFFMPTDGYTKSIMSVKQLLNYLSKRCGVAKKTNKISERTYLMRREPIEYTFIESKAFITYENEVLELDRGYPKDELVFSKDIVYDRTIKSMDWLIKNMNEDGSFLYFYDPYKNTVVDYLHPKMVDPLYNNILRHSGGTITLLRGYELSRNKLYLEKAKDSIDFLISTFKTHTYKKEFACYPFFNQKSKLGGAGIGLVAIMHYYMHTKDERYRKELDGLVRHILSRVDNDGEMIGYYIHPNYNDGKALINPSDDVKKELFSFYYPGEALLGLALYYHYINNINAELKADLVKKSELALDFLVNVRPIKYDYMFETLPADAWLMQAIEEWVKVDGFKKQSYIDFVFNDTKQMFDHMYKDENTNEKNKDYIGGFYYNYGDHVYHDASRCEGIVSAYYLAKYLKDDEQEKWIWQHMLLSAKGLMKTCHTPKSIYPYQAPKMAEYSFRFKLTRAWVRVDSVQHAACFYARLYMSNHNKEAYTQDINNIPQIIDGYEVIKQIDLSGFSSVHYVKKDKNYYALKDIYSPRFINNIEQEVSALRLMNDYPGALKFYKAKSLKLDEVYFLFEYAEEGNLKKHIKKNGIFNEQKALDFLIKMLDILSFSHNNNLLHLDIKPANILLHNDSYWLADWGLSKFKKCVQTVNLNGNPIFHAPEIYINERSAASDIYSLGCSLYYLVTGKNPFNLTKKIDNSYKIFLHLYEDPDLSMIKSSKISYIISKMMDKNPQTRITINGIRKLLNNQITVEVPYKAKNYDSIFSKNKLELYTIMAENGVAYAQTALGSIYEVGNGVDIDIQKSIQLYQKASVQGFSIAECSLGLLYYRDRNLDKDYKKAYKYLKKSASKEHAEGQYYFGKLFEMGYGVEKDDALAEEWFERSAKNSYKRAHLKLKKKYNKILKAKVWTC